MVKTRADVVIVGGGVVGVSIAYELAKLGCRDIVLLEKNYLGYGSTGRCGAGVRHQWGTEINCILTRESIKRLETLAEDLDYGPGIEFKQGGYLILAYSENQMAQFKKNVALQRRLGIDVEILNPEGAREIVPYLNTQGLIGATFCAKDGHANPFRVTLAYAQAARRLGVDIITDTEVTGIKVERCSVASVQTSRGRIDTHIVVNCAGPYAGIVAAMAGLDLPLYAERHQILVTEPVEPIQGPMVISFHHRLYCQQTPHGSFIMGLGDPNEPRNFNTRCSVEFLEEMAKKIKFLLPPLAALRVVRQWAGLYDMSPDAQPILGPCPPVSGFFNASGFSGHGFMVAPKVAELMAELILTGRTSIPLNMLDSGRFDRGELMLEPSVV